MRRSAGAIDVLIGIPVLLLGGTEVHTLMLVRALKGAGMRVTVCCYYDWTQSMVDALREVDADVTMLGLRRSEGLTKLFLRFRALCRELRPDVVHVQYVAPGLVPVVAARAAGVRTVFATVHQPGTRFKRRQKAMLRTAARLCTAFFCVSKAVEESWFGDSATFDTELAARGRTHFTIYNGVDVRAGKEDIATADEDKVRLGLAGKRVIGIVARLSQEKGHAVLFDALPCISDAVPHVMVLVVGDGPERRALLERAKRAGVGSRIVWAGEKPPTEVRRLYHVMDVFASPSLFEGFGLSVAEAMAAGCPTVGSRVGGLMELVEHGITGYLVPQGDSSALARALIGVLQDRALAASMGVQARARVAERFSAGRFASMIGSAYRHYRTYDAK